MRNKGTKLRKYSHMGNKKLGHLHNDCSKNSLLHNEIQKKFLCLKNGIDPMVSMM